MKPKSGSLNDILTFNRTILGIETLLQSERRQLVYRLLIAPF